MSNTVQQKDSNWSKIGSESKILGFYCLILSFLFVIVATVVHNPISDMMISFKRKFLGSSCLTLSIMFFLIFSFKSSRSFVFLVPFCFAIVFISFPVFLILQEPRKGFNKVHSYHDYQPFCNKDMNESFPSVSSDRFIVFRPTNTGTGNRLLALISSYLLSIVTGRQFMIDWQITPVFSAELSQLFTSTKIVFSSEAHGLYNITNNDANYLDIIVCRQCSFRPHTDSYSVITSKDINSLYQKKYLIVTSNAYFATSLIANHNYRSMICSKFQKGQLFKVLFEELFTLTDELNKTIDSLSQQFNNNKVIGIQIRNKDRVAFPSKDIYRFFNCADVIGSKYPNAMFFIATDTPSITEYAKEFFKDRLITSNLDPHVFDIQGIKSAIIDLILLSKCHELILTPYSTFGSVSAAIGGVIPHYITRKGGQCIKDVTSEPKCHYWHSLSHDHLKQYSSSDTLNQDEAFF